MVGQTLAHYEILEKIGSGGMGDVYLAEDTKLGRKVALKVLPPELAENEERRARFQREAKAIAALDHPNIVTVHSVEDADGAHFITMQLVQGKTLTELLPTTGFPLNKFFDIAIPLADAVAAAHQEGITHRDLKPDNVMVSDDGTVKVLDFGLARTEAPIEVHGGSESPTIPKTMEGALIGTLAYMSPEQVHGKAVDSRTDIYSLGVLFYELLTGKNPVAGDTTAASIASILKDVPPPIAKVPSEVDQVLAWCLRKDLDTRLQNALDLRNRLVELRDEPSSEAPRPGPWKKRVLAPGAATAALLLVLAFAPEVFERVNEIAAPQVANPVQLSFADGLEDYPTWSPDARTIAYHANNDGNFDVWIHQLGGSDALNRTGEYRGADQFPAWSPDGSQIAFWSERDGGGYFVMPALAGAPRKVSSGEALGAPCWWNDGRVAYFEFDGTRGWLSIVSLDTGERERFLVPSEIPPGLSPACHPDGEAVAFVSANQWESTRHGIKAVRLSDGVGFEITEPSGEAWSPAWWDQRTLTFLSDRGGVLDMWMRPIADDGEPAGEAVQLTTGLGLRSFAFSADGNRVAYSRGRRVANVWRMPRGLMRPATWDDMEQMTFEQALVEFVDVTPDGSQLLFDSDRAGNADLWLKDLETGLTTQVNSHEAPDWGGKFSPDGSEILFYSLRAGNRDVWVTSTSGGSPRQLTEFEGHDIVPIWSLDGEEIAYMSLRPSYDIYRVSSAGGEPVLVYATGERSGAIEWTSDGRRLLFTQDDRLWRVSKEGDRPQAITSTGGFSYMLRREPDGDDVYIVGTGIYANNIVRVSVDGEEHVVTDLSGRRGNLGLNGLAVDRNYVYFTWQDDLGDVWTMDMITEE